MDCLAPSSMFESELADRLNQVGEELRFWALQAIATGPENTGDFEGK